MSSLFVSAAGTEIGKTFVACALLHQLRRQNRKLRALKPVISGYDPREAATSDSGLLLTALGLDPTAEAVAQISPWRFKLPLSPHMAAKREDRRVDLNPLLHFCKKALDDRATFTLIEGVGGVMAPLNDDETVIDWMAALKIPALLVGGSYLGAISHMLTAAETVQRRDIPLAGIVLSESPEQPVEMAETAETIARFLPKVKVLTMPRLARFTDAPDLTSLVEGL
ncbi:MAG TPA: dethiobiotin synthase [Alphaproteobacteria bacterium]|nr:dethiobiotin synthase [Alphaproteobacteria bacterium]